MIFKSLPDLVSYDAARTLQHELVEARVRGEIEDTVLFLEHGPVVTRGRGLQFTGQPTPRHMPEPVLSEGVDFAESERGGDLTYHGPGQLVIYPIVKLDGAGFGPERDVGGFLRKLEGVLIHVLREHYGLAGVAHSNATGVWVGERKLASIGIAVRKWVTYHGMAVNCVNDLSAYSTFSPCGFAPEVMTRLEDLLPDVQREVWRSNWRQTLESQMSAAFLGLVSGE